MAELLYKGTLKGPLRTPTGGANAWAGRTTLNSGSATVTVSSTVVKSDSIIGLTVEANTRQSSGVAQPIEVMSMQEAVSFAFGTADGVAMARDTTIMWQLTNTSWSN